MAISFFNEGSIDALKNSLDGTNLRHKLIANNLANQNTENYVAQDLNFGMYMKMASGGNQSSPMKLTNSKHLGPGMAGFQDPGSFSSDFFNRAMVKNIETHPEEEMVKLAKNSIQYQASSEFLTKIYSLYNLGITGSVR